MTQPSWDLKSLRALLGPEARPLGYDSGPGYAFLAADVHGVKRSIVVLGRQTLVSFDLVPPGVKALAPLAAGVRTLRDTARKTVDGTLLLKVMHLEGALPALGEISSVELAGVRVADRVIVFHAAATTARSVISYSVEGAGMMKHLVTGLAPGTWEIWRDGWLEDPQGFVDPQAGALYFEGPAGGYFFRRLG